jgi:hypothetical protein
MKRKRSEPKWKRRKKEKKKEEERRRRRTRLLTIRPLCLSISVNNKLTPLPELVPLLIKILSHSSAKREGRTSVLILLLLLILPPPSSSSLLVSSYSPPPISLIRTYQRRGWHQSILPL